jgi:hypothetical protein
MPFSIIDVTAWPWYRDEQMGSKAKLWVLDDQGRRWLFKERRHDHGEDWAEKIAAETAALLGISHAKIELAGREEKAGIIALDFLANRSSIQLMHGNELLVQEDANYPAKGPNFRTPQHTVDKALAVLQQNFISLSRFQARPSGITSVPAEFVGYLMLDALVGNTDRHHENWAIIVPQTGRNGPIEAELAPMYDTASCLGRERTDDDRIRRMSGKLGAPTFEAYWRKMPSRWFRDAGDQKCLHPIDAFKLAAERYPAAARIWLAQCALLTDAAIDAMIAAIPATRISEPARQFAKRMLQFGRDQLIAEARIQ